LRGWYGMGEKLVTHKCPFYQFMFWGSLLMVATFPLFIFAYIIYGITKIIGLVVPSVPEHFESLKDENPFAFSMVISILAASITFFASLLFLDNAVAWVGYVILCIFAAPVIILQLLWALISWIGGIVGIFFVWIWGLLVAVNWGLLGYVVGMGLLYLLGVVATFWVLYRVAVFLFNRGVFNIFIKKSCSVREKRQEKKFARAAARIRRDAELKRERDKYYKAHKKELDARDKKREESIDKWIKTIGAILSPVGTVLGGFFSVIGAICVGIWWLIKKVGEIFYVIWHMITSTVSNHCPPIEFIASHEDVGELIPNRHDGGYLDGEKIRLHIDTDKFPEKFKLRTKDTDYKKVRISYNLVASEGFDYDGRYHVHSITAIKYLPKPRAKKVVKDAK